MTTDGTPPTGNKRIELLRRGMLASAQASDGEVEAALIEGIDRALAKPQRQQLPAGTQLFKAGNSLDAIWLLLEGRVRLSREIEGEETVFHSQTVGIIIGLLSLSTGGQSWFDCTASTDITVVKLPLDRLLRALQEDEALWGPLTTVVLRSLARRNRRAVELQLEVNQLNRDLAAERDQLATTLQQLQQAQDQLVEKEKMALLGRLVAGVAHELNNPVAAIQRAAGFLREDIGALADGHPDRDDITQMMDRAITQAALSTREQRKFRRDLARHLEDQDLAAELVAIGIHHGNGVERELGQMDPSERQERLLALKRYYQLGKSLRTVTTCTARISALIGGLRSQARGAGGPPVEVDVQQGLDETLLLFEHRLREIAVKRHYQPLPRVTCLPGALAQVWSNLVSNAIQAMGERGTLEIETEVVDDQHICVCITDSGSGIAREHLDHIFGVNFTTKQGAVAFGLGLGLPICHDIVTRHQGTISVESRPGRTRFRVVLPTHPSVIADRSPLTLPAPPRGSEAVSHGTAETDDG